MVSKPAGTVSRICVAGKPPSGVDRLTGLGDRLFDQGRDQITDAGADFLSFDSFARIGEDPVDGHEIEGQLAVSVSVFDAGGWAEFGFPAFGNGQGQTGDGPF